MVNRSAARRASLALAGSCLVAAGVAAGPPADHERTAVPGDHPRLLFSAAEVAARRAKVSEPGTLAHHIFEQALSAASPIATLPGYWDAYEAYPPALALLHDDPVARSAWARSAIDSSLAASRALAPPYPESPTWYGRFLYRYLALTYDQCYDAMTAGERVELAEELQQIAALLADRPTNEGHPGNHQLVDMTVLGLAAIALDGDVPAVARTIPDEPVVRGAVMSAGDFLRYRSSIALVRIGNAPGASDYTPSVDFVLEYMQQPSNDQNSGRAIKWLTANRPGAGQTYYVTYSFTPDTPLWKEKSRLTVQRNLDYVWSDGASQAGLLYGTWSLYWMVDLFEAFERNTGFDFADHPEVRGAVRWFPYERIPQPPGFPGVRANNRNDSHYDQLDHPSFGYVETFLAWAMEAYAVDPELDQVAAFFLGQISHWEWHRGWRGAIWAAGPYPMQAAAPALPPSRFFRGHDLASFRASGLDAPQEDWTLFSLASGPASGIEHDQTDRGSFTLYSAGEDFAIDGGYAQGNAASDSTAAHNFVLIDGAGQPGPWFTSAEAKAHLLSQSFDAVHGDLTKSYKNTKLWPDWLADEFPLLWPTQRAERFALFGKFDDRLPYVILADAIDRDGQAHDYAWLLHTANGNAIAIDGTKATITGFRGSGVLHVQLASVGSLTLRQDLFTAADPQVGTHPRLIAETADVVDPRFLALLIPERVGETDPLAVTRAEAPDHASVTLSHAGMTDRVVQNRTTNGAPFVAQGIETDASLAVVRTDAAGDVLAWLVLDGSTLTLDGRSLWKVALPQGARGSAVWDGASLDVVADEVRAFTAHAPGSTSFRQRDLAFAGNVAGESLHWSGARRLLDSRPAGTYAVDEDFTNAVSPYWTQIPLRGVGFSRSLDGRLCLLGQRQEWVSYTRRAKFDRSGLPSQVRADVSSWPRTTFRDATLTGTFDLVATGPGRRLRIARAADRAYRYEWEALEQDFVQIEIDPSSGIVELRMRSDGVEPPPLASASVGPLAPGTAHAYELTIDGNHVRFVLDGAPVIDHTEAGGLTPEGYFQWSVSPGMHVHLDDVRVALPGGATPLAPPGVTYVEPLYGHPAGGTAVTVHGTGFEQGARVTFGGVEATAVVVADGNTITCETPPHAAGVVAASVTNSDGQSGTLPNGFDYRRPGPCHSNGQGCETCDFDLDGFPETCDCDDDNDQAWAPPTAAQNLSWTDPHRATWEPSTSWGGMSVEYDVLRSADPSDFSTLVTCLPPDSVTGGSFTDAESPNAGAVYFYLVAVRNLCPASALGTSSSGVPRVGADCP